MNKTSGTCGTMEVLIYISSESQKEKDYSAKQTFEEAMDENFPNLAKDISL